MPDLSLLSAIDLLAIKHVCYLLAKVQLDRQSAQQTQAFLIDMSMCEVEPCSLGSFSILEDEGLVALLVLEELPQVCLRGNLFEVFF